jgi:hypothetical protein
LKEPDRRSQHQVACGFGRLLRGSNASPEPGAELGAQNRLEGRILAEKSELASAVRDDSGRPAASGIAGTPYVHAAPRTGAREPTPHQIPIGRRHGIPVQTEELAHPAYAGQPAARSNLTAEDAELELSRELASQGDAGSTIEQNPIEEHGATVQPRLKRLSSPAGSDA